MPINNIEKLPKFSQRRVRTPEEPEREQRIKIWMAWCLVLVALFVDLVEMLLDFVGIGLVDDFVLSPVIAFSFWLWFQILRVSYISSPKRFGTAIGSYIAESGIIPGLDTVPGLGFVWTLGIVAMVWMTRIEDGKGGIMSKAVGTASPIIGRRWAMASYGRQLTENAENLRPRLSKYSGYSKPEGLLSKTESEKRIPKAAGIVSPRLSNVLESSSPIKQVSTVSTPEIPYLTQRFDTPQSIEVDLNTYLENNVYENLGMSSKDEEQLLSLETSDIGRGQLRRSFENSRNSLSTLYRMNTVEGRVDEYAYSAEVKRRQSEVLHPILEKSFGDVGERMRQGGIEISLKEINLSADNFNINSLEEKLSYEKLEEKIYEKLGEKISNSLSSGQNYKGLAALTPEEQTDRATRKQWERKFAQIVSDEYSQLFGDFDFESFKRQAVNDISQTNNSLTPISRDKFRVKVSREQLTNEILEEHQKVKSSGFLNSNISASSLKKVIGEGQFKDVFSMTAEEREAIGGGGKTRGLTSYIEKRDVIERDLGTRQRGDEVVVYGSYASDFNGENLNGGASQYGDIFIKYKIGTRATYTEGDSMAPRDSELVSQKLFGKQFRPGEYDATLRQVDKKHRDIARALLNYDLQQQAKLRGNAEVGRNYAYLEAQIIDPTFDDIESINIPKAAFAKANDEEAEFLHNLANNPKWQGKVKFI